MGGLIPWNVNVICENVQDLSSEGKTFSRKATWRTIEWADNFLWIDGRISSDLCERPTETPPVR